MKSQLQMLKNSEPAPRRLRAIIWQGIVAGICFGWLTLAVAQTNSPAPTSLVLTNIKQIWDVSGEAAGQPQRIKTEVLIYYFDADWSCVFGECQGKTTFLPIFDSPMPLKVGDRVAIDGWVIPSKQRFVWDKTKVQVLAEDVPLQAMNVSDLRSVSADINGRIVSTSGLIESLNTQNKRHVRFRLLCGDVSVEITIFTPTNDLPFKEGDNVRLKGVYVPRFDRDGGLTESALWVAQRADVEVISSLSTDPRFDIPITPVEKISEGVSGDKMIRVAGTVRNHEPGKWITLWDDTGQVSIQSVQLQPLQFGDRIEAIGVPSVVGVQQFLRNAIYRVMMKASQTNPAAIMVSPPEPIRLAAQIQYLGSEDIKRHPLVNLRAVLMWAHRDTSFMYVQDASGGIRVVNPSSQETNLVPGSIVTVSGKVTLGDYVPVITNATITRVGWRGFDAPPPISLEQALTGSEDGRWVELRGFVRQVTKTGSLTHLELTTSRGEFQAWTLTSPIVDSLTGAIVRIGGTCSVIANARRQLTGIELWVPNQYFLKIDAPESTDVFASDLRPLGDLRRFNPQTDLNQRTKTIGTVVLHQPGRYLYLQDSADSVFALSRQSERLRPGERVEVVGFPGNERGKFLLREAIFRRLGGGVEPTPAPLSGVGVVNADLGGLLTQTEGVLLNIVRKDDWVRLLLRNGAATFEAAIEGVNGAEARQFQTLPLGSRLALTGVYVVQNDEYGRPNSFVLQLRSRADVRVLAYPSWWTLPRVLTLLLMVVAVFVIAVIWAILIARKNSLLRQTQSQLQNANRELEAFSYSVSHDLRAPLRSIDGFSRALLEDYADKLDAEGKEDLQTVRAASQRMGQLIDDMLTLAQVTRSQIHRAPVDLSAMAIAIAADLKKASSERRVEFVLTPGIMAQADARLIRIVLDNLLGNAWKFTGKQPSARIEFGRTMQDGVSAHFVRDNGDGFDMAYAQKLFGAFQRLHTLEEFPGTGIGLATVQRIIHRHGGRVWAESAPGKGATFYFTLPD